MQIAEGFKKNRTRPFAEQKLLGLFQRLQQNPHAEAKACNKAIKPIYGIHFALVFQIALKLCPLN